MSGRSQPQRLSYLPVEVEMGHLVSEPLHMVWVEARVITDDIEAGRGDSALAHRLAHKEEVIPGRTEKECLTLFHSTKVNRM